MKALNDFMAVFTFKIKHRYSIQTCLSLRCPKGYSDGLKKIRTLFSQNIAKAYSDPCQIRKMEHFAETIMAIKSFAKRSILDV